MEKVKSKYNISYVLFLMFGLLFTSIASAGQCIKNDSGASLDVTWYNANGHKDNNASNHNLTFGNKACQNNSNLGYAHIHCNACAFADEFTDAAIVVGGVATVGAICVASGGSLCGIAANMATPAITAAINSVPPGMEGKLLAVPGHGKTVRVKGNAFGLKFDK